MQEKIKDDTISRQAILSKIKEVCFSKEWVKFRADNGSNGQRDFLINYIEQLPPAQPEHLTDDDFETIRIHLSAYKEKLCNQSRWKEAEEYQRIIDRFMSFASTQPEHKKGKWERHNTYHGDDTSGFVDPDWRCSECGKRANINEWLMYDLTNFCPNCGADMRGEQNE